MTLQNLIIFQLYLRIIRNRLTKVNIIYYPVNLKRNRLGINAGLFPNRVLAFFASNYSHSSWIYKRLLEAFSKLKEMLYDAGWFMSYQISEYLGPQKIKWPDVHNIGLIWHLMISSCPRIKDKMCGQPFNSLKCYKVSKCSIWLAQVLLKSIQIRI